MLNDVGVNGTLHSRVATSILISSTAAREHWVCGWALTTLYVVCNLLLDGLVCGWEEDDFGVGRFSHLLHGLEVSGTLFSYFSRCSFSF
jgi:hypothetical protein